MGLLFSRHKVGYNRACSTALQYTHNHRWIYARKVCLSVCPSVIHLSDLRHLLCCTVTDPNRGV